MIASLAAALDTLGLVAFAVTGALVASRKLMDITGFALLAIVTGVGGGTLRDLLLGISPVGWVIAPRPVITCAAVGVLTFFLAHVPRSRLRLVLWLDAVGLATFAAGGARTALEAGAPPSVAILMGVGRRGLRRRARAARSRAPARLDAAALPSARPAGARSVP